MISRVLPDEVLLNIFSHLDANSLIRALHVLAIVACLARFRSLFFAPTGLPPVEPPGRRNAALEENFPGALCGGQPRGGGDEDPQLALEA